MYMQEHNAKNKNSATASRWLSLQSGSAYSGVSSQTLRNWAKAGHIRLHNVSPMGSRGRVLIDRLELDSFIEQFAGAPSSTLVMNSNREGSLA
jgi:hypothetical protein